jgi:hypothetical protein
MKAIKVWLLKGAYKRYGKSNLNGISIRANYVFEYIYIIYNIYNIL